MKMRLGGGKLCLYLGRKGTTPCVHVFIFFCCLSPGSRRLLVLRKSGRARSIKNTCRQELAKNYTCSTKDTTTGSGTRAHLQLETKARIARTRPKTTHIATSGHDVRLRSRLRSQLATSFSFPRQKASCGVTCTCMPLHHENIHLNSTMIH